MRLFGRKKDSEEELRAYNQHYYSTNISSISSFFGSNSQVTEVEALKIPSIAAGVELISSSIAQLPISLYKRDEENQVHLVEDYRTFLLNDEPNEFINGHNFKKQLTKDYIFYGASYVLIEKARNKVTSLHNLDTSKISVDIYKRRGIITNANINYIEDQTDSFAPEDLVIILRDSPDGFTSTGILNKNSDIIRLALDEQKYTAGILKNGALPIGVLESASRLTQPAIDRLRAQWQSLYVGADKAGKTVILEEGLKYNPISMKPNELDLTNIRRSNLAEISRILNIPESMLNAAANKYASNEANNLYFLQYCLAPIITEMESALNKSLLLESEKQNGYYFLFDTSQLLRTTEKDKIETIALAREKGLISWNEARYKMDMPKLKNDYFMLSLGNIFYSEEDNKFIIPNSGVAIDADDLENSSATGGITQTVKGNPQQNNKPPALTNEGAKPEKTNGGE